MCDDNHRTKRASNSSARRVPAFAMIGNSLRSDILPVLELGGCGVHMPYHVTWAHEAEAVPPSALDALDRLRSVREPAELPAAVRSLAAG